MTAVLAHVHKALAAIDEDIDPALLVCNSRSPACAPSSAARLSLNRVDLHARGRRQRSIGTSTPPPSSRRTPLVRRAGEVLQDRVVRRCPA